MKKIYLLIVFAIGCILFATYNFYQKIVVPFSPFKLKCEGIVLDSTLSYHITDKEDIASLKKIRGEDIEISDNDVLLHYRDANMDIVTPSYWGTMFYDGEWKFHLDKSFTTDPEENKSLPFLRYAEKVNGSIVFVKPNSTLNETELKKKLFVNYHSGDTGSRYYIHIKEIKGKKVLPFYDDGSKRIYAMGRNIDTITLAFNTLITKPRHYNFNFDNTSKKMGLYELIYTPQEKEKLLLKNTSNGKVTVISNTDNFQIEDMVFSLTKRYSLLDVSLLTTHLLIVIFSLYFFFKRLRKKQDLFSENLIIFKISLLCFLLLGFPILALAFDYQNFEWYQKIAYSIGVPFVPLSAFLISKHFKPIKKWTVVILFNNILIKHHIFKNIKLPKWTKYIVYGLLFILVIAALFHTPNERVLGLFPVLHYAKILLFIGFIIIYSNWFGSLVIKIFKNKFLRKYLFFLAPFIPGITLVVLAILISIRTKDIGILLFTVISVVIMNVLLFDKRRIGKFQFSWLLGIIPLIIILLFLSGEHIDYGRKIHRLTYTIANPQSDFYKNSVEADRQTFAFQYQALQSVITDPLGVKNVNIQQDKKSVSHTDYAIMWSTLNGGVILLGLLLIGMGFLLNSLLLLIKRLSLVDSSADTSVLFLDAFLAFTLLMLLLQMVIPFSSNLMLPFAFLTGVPFPFVGLSIGDAAFLFFILILLQKTLTQKNSENNNINIIAESKAFSFKWTRIILVGLMAWVTLGIIRFKIQNSDSSSWDKNTINPIVENIKYHSFKNNDELLEVMNNVFKDKDMQELDAKDKYAGAYFNCLYYKNNPKKLLGESPRFSLDQNLIKNKLSLDSLFSKKTKIISGNKWNEKSVYKKSVFINGKEETTVTSPYYSNLDLENINLDLDVSALINKELEKFILIDLKRYNNLKASVLIMRNDNNTILVNSAYPFSFKHPETDINFFPGSIKKVLLADYVYENYPEKLKEKIFPLNESKSIKGNALDWIALSNNFATTFVWDSLVNQKEFESFLLREYDLPFISVNYLNGYANKNWDRDSNSIYRTYIGGECRYTPLQISEWFQKLANKSLKNNTLKVFLNQPLTHPGGTAKVVANALKKEGLNPVDFIVKTGTLEEKDANGVKRNISTGFVIANNKFTVTVLIDGVQPNNEEHKSSKDLFVKLLPIINTYMNSLRKN